MSHSYLQGNRKCKHMDFWHNSLNRLPSIQTSHAGYKGVFSDKKNKKTSYLAWMSIECMRIVFLLCDTRSLVWNKIGISIIVSALKAQFQANCNFMTDNYLSPDKIRDDSQKLQWQTYNNDNIALWISFWLLSLACLPLSTVLSTCLSWLSDRQMFGLWGEKVTPLGVLSPVIGCHTQLPKVGKSDFLASTNIEGVRPGIIWQGEGFNCRCKCVCLTS